MRKALFNLTIAITLIILLGVYYKSLAWTDSSGTVSVVRVHDGDTVSVVFKGKRQKLRLIGIDAPEMGQEPWGLRAKRHLKKILKSSGYKVRLGFDIERTDKYGRLLGYLWTEDGSMVNTKMIRDGYGKYSFKPFFL